jgi:helicase required for RNAi-mediated heterochromatin assembly 1
MQEERINTVNSGGVFIIKEIVNSCLSMGVEDIMVTTSYKQQERMLQLHLPSIQERGDIRVGTIDKFQGQEDEVTIISMVRSNSKIDHHESIGFVSIPRTCVAFSEAEKK